MGVYLAAVCLWEEDSSHYAWYLDGWEESISQCSYALTRPEYPSHRYFWLMRLAQLKACQSIEEWEFYSSVTLGWRARKQQRLRWIYADF